MLGLRKIQFLLVAIFTTVALASCSGAINPPTRNSAQSTTTTTNCRTIQHQMGETEICKQPENIVALGPYILESLLALNVQPAGFADHMMIHKGDYDNPSQQIPYLGNRVTSQPANVGSAYTPSIEAILKLQPDLILGLESNNARDYETLSQIAPTLLFHWADRETNLKVIAKTVGRLETAEQLLTHIEQQIATARESFAPIVAAHPKVLLLSSAQLQDIYLGNSSGLCSSLVQELGFQLIFPPGLDKFEQDKPVPISLEILPQLNEADLVILLGRNFSDLNQLNGTNNFEEHQLSNLKQAWKKNAIAQSLDASKAGRVYFIPAYMCLGLPGSIGTKLYLDALQKQLLPSR